MGFGDWMKKNPVLAGALAVGAIAAAPVVGPAAIGGLKMAGGAALGAKNAIAGSTAAKTALAGGGVNAGMGLLMPGGEQGVQSQASQPQDLQAILGESGMQQQQGRKRPVDMNWYT